MKYTRYPEDGVNRWEKIPHCPVTFIGLANFMDSLLAVGGMLNGERPEVTNKKILSLMRRNRNGIQSSCLRCFKQGPVRLLFPPLMFHLAEQKPLLYVEESVIHIQDQRNTPAILLKYTPVQPSSGTMLVSCQFHATGCPLSPLVIPATSWED